MPLSNAERQRKYREKRDNDPSRRAEYLTKCKEKYKSDVAVGKRKLINELSERGKRNQRKKWRTEKRIQRKRTNARSDLMTPPPSPNPQDIPQQQEHHMTKRRRREIAKCYRDNERLKKELESQKRLTHKYMMRFRRALKDRNSQSPRSKTRRLLMHLSTEKTTGNRKKRRISKQKVKRALMSQFVLKEAVKEKYKHMKKGQKSGICEVIRGKIMRKYKFMCRVAREVNMSGGRNRIKRGTLVTRVGQDVHRFFNRDDVSRITSGTHDTITRNGQKKQRRILSDRLDKLHEKYITENTNIKISYTTFCRLRPFYVQPPKESDRETCACRHHENIQFIVDALHRENEIKSKRTSDVVAVYACDVNNMACMYGNCSKCPEIRLFSNSDKNREVIWYEWKSKKEERNIRNKEKEVTLTVKEKNVGMLGMLIDKFEEQMKRFKVHVFNIKNQIDHYRSLKEDLTESECLIHIDFSENYVCKMKTEVQSMHFGASKKQITLHTGVYYTKNMSKTFCGVSDSLDHGPSAIWAFLDPVIDEILKDIRINKIHFYSDGPCAQYRQKGNFYLLSKFANDREIQATWNFHETGHGKGVPDGVGGSVKRMANSAVLHGYKDITNAKTFVEVLNENKSATFIYEIKADAIQMKSNILNAVSLKTVPGTFRLHQVKTYCSGEIWYRDVSCLCQEGNIHEGHSWNFSKLQGSKENQNSNIQKRTETKTQEKSKRKTPTPELLKEPVQVPETSTELSDRQKYFSQTLKELETCKTFERLEQKCKEMSTSMKDYQMDTPSEALTVEDSGKEIYSNALNKIPNDIPDKLQPIHITGDGNCLPNSGSILAFGSENHSEEIRVRIIMEQTLHMNKYLSDEYLQRGLDQQRSRNSLKKSFALYSDEYNANQRLADSHVKTIYKKEVIKLTKNRSFMGIWQIFALASVLRRSIFSVYPNLGDPFVRKDLHRLILPRANLNSETSYIMWTSTRTDMNQSNWIPNHFVVLLRHGKEKEKEGCSQRKADDQFSGETYFKIEDQDYRQSDCKENETKSKNDNKKQRKTNTKKGHKGERNTNSKPMPMDTIDTEKVKVNTNTSQAVSEKIDKDTSQADGEKVDVDTKPVDRQKVDMDTSQFDREKVDMDTQVDREKVDMDTSQVDREKVDMDTSQFDREKVDMDTQVDRQNVDMDTQVDREKVDMDTQVDREKVDMDTGQVDREKVDMDINTVDSEKVDMHTSQFDREKVGMDTQVDREKVDMDSNQCDGEKVDMDTDQVDRGRVDMDTNQVDRGRVDMDTSEADSEKVDIDRSDEVDSEKVEKDTNEFSSEKVDMDTSEAHSEKADIDRSDEVDSEKVEKDTNQLSSEKVDINTNQVDSEKEANCIKGSVDVNCNHVDLNDTLPRDLLGKYVVVNYDDEPYPGLEIDCDDLTFGPEVYKMNAGTV